MGASLSRAERWKTDGVLPENSSVAIVLRFAGLIRYWPVMVRWLGILVWTLRSTVRTQGELALANLALRQQVAVWKRRQPRRPLTAPDRIFSWVVPRCWR